MGCCAFSSSGPHSRFQALEGHHSRGPHGQTPTAPDWTQAGPSCPTSDATTQLRESVGRTSTHRPCGLRSRGGGGVLAPSASTGLRRGRWPWSAAHAPSLWSVDQGADPAGPTARNSSTGADVSAVLPRGWTPWCAVPAWTVRPGTLGQHLPWADCGSP